MDSVESFKKFIQTMPRAASSVHEGRYTWQQLYEMYVLYGESHEIWNDFKNKPVEASNNTVTSTFDLNTLMQVLKTIDVNALMSSMEGLGKVLGIVATLFDKDEVEDKGFQSLSRMDD